LTRTHFLLNPIFISGYVPGKKSLQKFLSTEVARLIEVARLERRMSDGQFLGVIVALALVFTGHPILGFILAILLI
jgi:hypothetical protein